MTLLQATNKRWSLDFVSDVLADGRRSALTRSATWYDNLVSGRATSFPEIAGREGVAERYIAKPIPLTFLDPQLVNECIEGRTKPA